MQKSPTHQILLLAVLVLAGCASGQRPPVSQIHNTTYSIIDSDALLVMQNPMADAPVKEADVASTTRKADAGDADANFKMGKYMERKAIYVTYTNYQNLIPLADTIKNTPAYLDYQTAAMAYYTKAADKGNTEAMVRLGEMYKANGLIAARPYADIAKSVIWLEKANAAGNTEAACELGSLFIGGYYVAGVNESMAPDKPRALRYLAEGGDKNNPRCLSTLISLNHIDLGRTAFAKLNALANNGSNSKDSVDALKIIADRAVLEKSPLAVQFNERLLTADPTGTTALGNLYKIYQNGLGIASDTTKAQGYLNRLEAMNKAELNRPGAIQVSLAMLQDGKSFNIIPGLANADKVINDEAGFHKLMRYKYTCETNGDERTCTYPAIRTRAVFKRGRLTEVVTTGLNRIPLSENLLGHFDYTDTPYGFARTAEPLCQGAPTPQACRWRFWYDLKTPSVEKVAVLTDAPGSHKIEEVRVVFKPAN